MCAPSATHWSAAALAKSTTAGRSCAADGMVRPLHDVAVARQRFERGGVELPAAQRRHRVLHGLSTEIVTEGLRGLVAREEARCEAFVDCGAVAVGDDLDEVDTDPIAQHRGRVERVARPSR